MHPLVTINAPNLDLVSLPASVALPALEPVEKSDLSNYFARPILVRNFACGTPIVNDMDSADLWPNYYAAPMIAAKLKGYLRGTYKSVKYTAVYPGAPTAIGTIQLVFFPRVGLNDVNVDSAAELPLWFALNALGTHTQLPSLRINVEEACSTSIVLPCPSARGSFPLSTGGDWVVMMRYLSPFYVTNGTSPPPFTIQLYASYTDFVPSVLTIAQGDETGGWLSQRLSYLSSLSAQFSSVAPTILTPFSMMTKGAAALASLAGFSKPVSSLTGNTYRALASNLATVSGDMDCSVPLKLDPGAALDVMGKSIPMKEAGDTEVSSVCARWGLISTSTVAFGGNHIVRVHPLSCLPGTLKQLTPTGFVAMGFDVFNGEIEIKVEFCANALISAMYAILIVPPGASVPASYSGNDGFPSQIVTVRGRTEVVVTVPYNYGRRFTYCGDPPSSAGSTTENYTRLVLYNLSIIGGSSATIPDLTVLYWMRAPKMAFALPSLTTLQKYTDVVSGTIQQGLEFQGLETSPLVVSTFGEQVVDLVQLTRRSTVMVDSLLWNPPTEYFAMLLPALGLTPDNSDTVFTPYTSNSRILWTYATWFTKAYFGCTGGYRYKLYAPETTSTDSLWVTPGFGSASFIIEIPAVLSLPAAPSTGRGASRSLGPPQEIELPSITTDLFRPCYKLVRPTAAGSTGNIEGAIVQGVSEEYTRTILYSAADDFVFGGFLAAPPLVLVT